MNSRGHMQPYLNSSLAIRQEIQRFESVHPSIYAIYDLIEAIPDPLIQQQIREHVVCIEDSFVNSQEWTLSRSVPDLKLGILGSINSGKSALVHRYLTGSYMQEESPEGGRFKKEVVIDGQSYLLLIRDEGGPPETQFTHWVDAVIYVFSLENEISFNSIYSYHDKMSHFRTISEIPLILVGTQDAISESNPRLIDDIRARKLATDLKRCSYYETCATYGLNVERVFQDACSKIIQAKSSMNSQSSSRPSTPNHSSMRSYYVGPSPNQNSVGKGYDSHSTGTGSSTGSGNVAVTTPAGSNTNIQSHSPPFKESREKDRTSKKNKDRSESKDVHPSNPSNRYMRADSYHQAMPVSCPIAPQMPHVEPPSCPPPHPDRLTPPHVQNLMDYRDFPVPSSTPLLMRRNSKKNSVQKSNSFSTGSNIQISDLNGLEPPCTPMLSRKFLSQPENYPWDQDGEFPENPTPTGTPTQSRKNRRRSALFNAKKEDDKLLGSGRAIPIKQGWLYKKSNKPLNKEWKKKYVTLCDDGRLIIYQSLNEYRDEKEGKEILLSKTTVKIPGGRPRCAAPIQPTQIKTNPNHNGDINLCTRTSVPHGFEMDGAMVIPNASIAPGGFNGVDFPSGSPTSKIETPNVKKKHRRAKSGTNKNIDDGDSDGFEFIIVSLDNKSWHFEAVTFEDREDWICAIEQQILVSLQGNESSKTKSVSQPFNDVSAGALIRSVKGNMYCADCDTPNPDWASLNLGALICIECSGIHRNLGTHLSRVRSLDLDSWPSELISVMTCIGNSLANSIWEYNIKGRQKPNSQTSREEREKWIRSKYDNKDFLPLPPYDDVALNQQIIDAVARQDIHNAILVLAYSKSEHVNTPYSKTDTRTALHIGAALGNSVLVQLLLWYGAETHLLDHEGRNSMWYARNSGSRECVNILVAQGMSEHPTLPRRRTSSQPPNPNQEMFEKLPSSVI